MWRLLPCLSLLFTRPQAFQPLLTGQVSLISDHPCCFLSTLFMSSSSIESSLNGQVSDSWDPPEFRHHTEKNRQNHFGMDWKRPLEDDKLKQTCRVPLTSEELSHGVQTQELMPLLNYTLLFKQKQPTKPTFKAFKWFAYMNPRRNSHSSSLWFFSMFEKHQRADLDKEHSLTFIPTIVSILSNQQFLRSLQKLSWVASALYSPRRANLRHFWPRNISSVARTKAQELTSIHTRITASHRSLPHTISSSAH